MQACHALQQFCFEHHEIGREHLERSNYLALLSVENEEKLFEFIKMVSSRGIRHSEFREPDLDGALTAVALEPGKESRRLCSNFPLALKT